MNMCSLEEEKVIYCIKTAQEMVTIMNGASQENFPL